MMSNHRPTTLERAYELARAGGCRTVGDIKTALQAEGFERIQDSLYGPTLTAALRKLCQEHYIPTPEGEAAE
jgi:virulence-associated protein VapD